MKGSHVAAFLIGAIAGGVAALLYAPQSGKKPVNRYANMWARRWNRRVSSWSVLRPKRKMP